MGMIDKMVSFVTDNPRAAAIGWLLTILGFVVGVIALIITIKAITKKELSYLYETTKLVEKEVAKARNIKILYKEKPIERLSVTTFHIQNSGNTQINAKEMIAGFELMVVGAVEIVSVEIEKASHIRVTKEKSIEPINNARNTIELEKDDISFVKPNEEYAVVQIPFTTFQKKDYMILNIYHTGGDETIFKLLGTGDNLKIVNKLAEKELKEMLFNPSASSMSLSLAIADGVIGSIKKWYRSK